VISESDPPSKINYVLEKDFEIMSRAEATSASRNRAAPISDRDAA
jgi:hypothetical protein